jgi:hypothetical protein
MDNCPARCSAVREEDNTSRIKMILICIKTSVLTTMASDSKQTGEFSPGQHNHQPPS